MNPDSAMLAKETIKEDIAVGRDILEYARRNPQILYNLGKTGKQDYLMGLLNMLCSNRAAWCQRLPNPNRAQVMGGILRAAHALTDPVESFFFQYELRIYSDRERELIDPPPPETT